MNRMERGDKVSERNQRREKAVMGEWSWWRNWKSRRKIETEKKEVGEKLGEREREREREGERERERCTMEMSKNQIINKQIKNKDYTVNTQLKTF